LTNQNLEIFRLRDNVAGGVKDKHFV